MEGYKRIELQSQVRQPCNLGKEYLRFSEPQVPHLLSLERDGLDQYFLNVTHYRAAISQLFHYYLHILNLLPFKI